MRGVERLVDGFGIKRLFGRVNFRMEDIKE